jgi:ABC-type sugar transport system substrate-binding protein
MRSRRFVDHLIALGLALSFILLTFGVQGCGKRNTQEQAVQDHVEISTKPTRRIAFVMKLVGIPYTNACERGMKQAAKELGIEAEFLGPNVGGDIQQQIAIIEDQISRGVDAIVISPNDSQAVKPVIEKAMKKGVKVFTWDSDAPDSKRIFYVAGADDVGIGVDVIDHIAKDIGGKGKVAVLSGGATAPNLNLHIQGVEKGVKKYPGIQLVKPYCYNDDDQQKAIQQALGILQKHPDLAAFACMNSPAVPGAARALIQAGREGKVVIWGLSLPSENRDYIKSGIVNGLTLWDPAKLTYLTTKLVNDYLDGKKPVNGMEVPNIGRLEVRSDGTIIMPGAVITKENVDQFDF